MNSDPKSNEAWCTELYQRKATELVLYGRALGLSHGEAEDVVQEVFVALLNLPARPDNPVNYCVRMFRNRALNHRRNLWTRIRKELESRRWFERSPGEQPWEREAMRALEQLPREQREVIVLKFWQQHTFEEIAGIVEASPNTVAGRYRYGIAKIKKQLNQHELRQRERESIGAADAVLAAASGVARA